MTGNQNLQNHIEEITMASFDKYAPKLRKWEGNKFVNDPDDYGGATNKGVTLDTFRMVYGADKTVDDLRNMTEDQWRGVMKGYFWDKCKGDMINNQSVAEIFVDWCINAGIDKIKRVQAMVGTKADGVVGPKTVFAINSAAQESLHGKIKLARAKRYVTQIENKASQMKYFNGWFNRIIDFNYEK